MLTERDDAIRQATALSVGAFVEELVRAGVRDFCLAPGSRSTPLAIAVARQAGARPWMHLDERSAAFFALGLAKASRTPVALVCTSGTAAANFLPAVVEAYYARVPLVVVTSDRPHELRAVGAPQTIDQVNLYGRHAKWFVDLPEPDLAPDVVRYLRSTAARAAATARATPAGPVHLNWPFREPLVPAEIAGDADLTARQDVRGYVDVLEAPRALPGTQVDRLARELRALPRGLILAGPQDDPEFAESVTRLARALGYPILADPLSGVRCGAHDRSLVLDAYDALLRDATFASRFAPEVTIRFGAMPTSKPVLQYLQRHQGARQVVVDDGGWNEPTSRATDLIHADARLLCDTLVSAVLATDSADPAWAAAWSDANHLARKAISSHLEAMDELFEGRVFAELADLLPDGATLWAGSSMPVRDLDTFFPSNDRHVRFLSSRGANGIDGVVSSALGASVASEGPLVLAIGDVSFYHDSNGLLAAGRHGLNATIVLLNNDGGGIFSFLPQATEAPDCFEALWGTPHGLDFRPLCETYGARYTRVEGWDGFRAAVRRGLADGGLHVVEVPAPSRDRNVVLHRQVWPLVAAAVSSGRQAAAAL